MSSDLRYGIDIGTTSVSGVAVDGSGKVVASVTIPHHADLPTNGNGIDEQDPNKLFSTTLEVLSKLPLPSPLSPLSFLSNPSNPSNLPNLSNFTSLPIGWTGQMHGVVAVDRDFNPLTPFVTWRDARRYGGEVMKRWGQTPTEGGQTPTPTEGTVAGHTERIFKCLTAPGFAIAKLTGKCVIDPTFMESWHISPGTVPSEWLPEVDDFSMLGDNQAGVYAARSLYPGCAVVNLGTSGQLSIVTAGDRPHEEGDRPHFEGDRPPTDGDRPQWDFSKVEKRCFPNGQTLICRASLVGGQALAALQRRLGMSWDELNEKGLRGLRDVGTDPVTTEILACVDEIVEDLFEGMDLTGVKTLVGVGNALVRNPMLRMALEKRSGLKCVIPGISEMAAYGAAVYCRHRENRVPV